MIGTIAQSQQSISFDLFDEVPGAMGHDRLPLDQLTWEGLDKKYIGLNSLSGNGYVEIIRVTEFTSFECVSYDSTNGASK